MRYEAVIFDLDGTLLDTLEDLTDAVNEALRDNGLPERALSEIRDFVGNGIAKLIERALPDGKKNSAYDRVLEKFRLHYREHCRDKTRPYPGVEDMMRRLRGEKIGMAIVSNKADFAVKELRPVYFDGLIEVACGENEAAGIPRKPGAEMVWAALRQLNCPAERAVYVGDSDVDIQTAENAGMDCISVSWGFRSRKFLVEHGAGRIVDTPEELLDCVLSSRDDDLL